MDEKKIVVHKKDGAIHKGVTHDFDPGGPAFHLLPAEGGGVPLSMLLEDLKAVFYVKDYIGNRDFVARKQFAEAHEGGRKAVVCFDDGEEVWGVTLPAEGRAESPAGEPAEGLVVVVPLEVVKPRELELERPV